jgi:hypothetical protein
MYQEQERIKVLGDAAGADLQTQYEKLQAMKMTREQIAQVISSVKKSMGKSVAYTGNFVPQQQKSCSPTQQNTTPSLPPSKTEQVISPITMPKNNKSSNTKGFGNGISLDQEIKNLLEKK